MCNHHQATTLRSATVNDQPFLFELYASTRAAEMGLVAWNEAEKARFLQAQFAAWQAHYRAAFPDEQQMIVWQAGEPAGAMYVSRPGYEIQLLDLTLAPRYRAAGLGTRLMHALMVEAAQRAIPIRLYIWQANAAGLRFFLRLGFRQINSVGAYLCLEWRI